MFKVETDKEILTKFEKMKENLEIISKMFKEGDKEISAEELGNWNMIVNQTRKDVTKLLRDASNRINFIDK